MDSLEAGRACHYKHTSQKYHSRSNDQKWVAKKTNGNGSKNKRVKGETNGSRAETNG
jgi:hypothetical protein